MEDVDFNKHGDWDYDDLWVLEWDISSKHGDNHDLWAFTGFRMGYCFNWQLMGNGFEACSIIAYGGYYLYVILVYRLICHLQSKFCFQFQGNYIMSGDFLVWNVDPNISGRCLRYFLPFLVVGWWYTVIVAALSEVAQKPWNSGLKWPTWERRDRAWSLRKELHRFGSLMVMFLLAHSWATFAWPKSDRVLEPLINKLPVDHWVQDVAGIVTTFDTPEK